MTAIMHIQADGRATEIIRALNSNCDLGLQFKKIFL